MYRDVFRMNTEAPSRRQTQIAERIAQLSGEFFSHESNRESLITVTRSDISADLKNATVYISVLPQSAEKKALAFAKRERSALRNFVKKKVTFSTIPTIEVVIDIGEKNRQQVSRFV